MGLDDILFDHETLDSVIATMDDIICQYDYEIWTMEGLENMENGKHLYTGYSLLFSLVSGVKSTLAQGGSPNALTAEGKACVKITSRLKCLQVFGKKMGELLTQKPDDWYMRDGTAEALGKVIDLIKTTTKQVDDRVWEGRQTKQLHEAWKTITELKKQQAHPTMELFIGGVHQEIDKASAQRAFDDYHEKVVLQKQATACAERSVACQKVEIDNLKKELESVKLKLVICSHD